MVRTTLLASAHSSAREEAVGRKPQGITPSRGKDMVKGFTRKPERGQDTGLKSCKKSRTGE